MASRFRVLVIVSGIAALGLLAWAGRRPVRAGEERPAPVQTAVVVLQPVGGSGVSGTIRFVQRDGVLEVTGTVTGLTPGPHGFHIHEYGDLTDTREGLSAGGHYNPTGRPHGAPGEARRHVGDLGNIVADAQGVARINVRDGVIRLDGPYSIVGRAAVVHAQADKFTQPVGDAGGRVAFGVVGIAAVDK